ncbi:nucleotide sugar dehydrogenase [Thiohalorhabdus denitrificans]|uniref:nucleotide sugar dehydrogenase n=1 Tax=Thiohalorhabdus denitrificans TaxID=381306 RepID=UPI0009E8E761|nr:nucleotide sugar dehydrogenase [Thiohalorhabdus denitrificans]
MEERIGVVGLGYVGLPVALGFAGQFEDTVGFDISSRRISALREGRDETGEVDEDELGRTSLSFTADPDDLERCTLYVVTVPTPLDGNHQPDLRPLRQACATLGPRLSRGDLVAFESTVYPGVTEECCGPILAEHSGLRQGVDFKLGYSPERINPGDREHTLDRIVKVVSGEDEEALERLAAAYGAIVSAGVHRAPSIKTAEAAKVIENTQRDLNIALMNELALIFDRIGVRTNEVLEAAGTKWNFLPFSPGLVGGHCIGVDPYYLTAKAEAVGYHPHVILAGRRVNDGMGEYLAQRVVKLLIQTGRRVKSSRVGILGLTFKENVPDIRNSRVPDIIAELAEFGVQTLVSDPLADPQAAWEEYGVELMDREEWPEVDAMILAVPHRTYQEMAPGELLAPLAAGGVLVDLKARLEPATLPPETVYWSL